MVPFRQTITERPPKKQEQRHQIHHFDPSKKPASDAEHDHIKNTQRDVMIHQAVVLYKSPCNIISRRGRCQTIKKRTPNETQHSSNSLVPHTHPATAFYGTISTHTLRFCIQNHPSRTLDGTLRRLSLMVIQHFACRIQTPARALYSTINRTAPT